MTALEMELIVVPDSIEPYIGFKYLSWHEGKLWSQWGDKPWPINKPFEAECHGPREYKWETTTGTPQPRQEIAPPDIALPAGLSWSWEPQPPHPAVDEECHCGIYAVDTPDLCADYGRPQVLSSVYDVVSGVSASERVLVELAMWGKVIPGTTGMRGQFAYPQKIHGSSEAAREAAKAYGVQLVEREPEGHKPKRPSSFNNSFSISTGWDWLDSTSKDHKRPTVVYLMWGAFALNVGFAALNFFMAI
jgi:hypothetical protein